jgi:hypothetical protein
VIGAPGNNVSRGSLFYSRSDDNTTFDSGRLNLPNAAGMTGDVVTDQYQGQEGGRRGSLNLFEIIFMQNVFLDFSLNLPLLIFVCPHLLMCTLF